MKVPSPTHSHMPLLLVESFKSVVTSESLEEPSQREEAKKVVKKALEEKHQAGKNKWFFTKLHF